MTERTALGMKRMWLSRADEDDDAGGGDENGHGGDDDDGYGVTVVVMMMVTPAVGHRITRFTSWAVAMCHPLPVLTRYYSKCLLQGELCSLPSKSVC